MPRLEVLEGKQAQTPNESIPYRLKVTEWVDAVPTSASVTVLDVTDPYSTSDVTSTVVDGEAAGAQSGSDYYINVPNIEALTDGHEYLVRVLFSSGGGTYEAAFRIMCVDFLPN